MNEENATSNSETIIDQNSAPKSNNESIGSQSTENTQKLIPRHQNKMVAEKTSDMYFSGLMSE